MSVLETIRAQQAADAQPVADEAGGPPPSRRTAKPPAVEGEKHCGSCNQSKPVAEFNKRTGARDGLQSQCRTCNRKAAASSRTVAVADAAPAPSKPAGWVDPATRLKLIRERAAGSGS